jgi:hypothetical protein
MVMPEELAYDFAGETMASLTREVAYLRQTVAHLRAATHVTLPAPRPAPSLPVAV